MRIGILGAGESGIGAALLARKLKHDAFVSDHSEIASSYRDELIINNIPFEERGHTIEILEQTDIIVKSPGIPSGIPIVKRLLDTGKPVISEVEYAFRACAGKIVAITGTNGKTTTASLIWHIARGAGLDAVLCGNVGKSFARSVAENGHQWFVVEVSSFQLDDIGEFRPDIALILNITPDHLDRYGGDFNSYAQAKLRIAENQQSGDVLIYNGSDPEIVSRLPVISGPKLRAITAEAAAGLDLNGLPGAHNALNAACAAEAAKCMGVMAGDIRSAVASFNKPEHRMEIVAEIRDVRFINDSKATNVEAARYALDAVEGPVIWIAGGQDKGNDYALLEPVAREKVKLLVALGIDNDALVSAFGASGFPMVETKDMGEAVAIASERAEPGDTVLLSPACASFDLFENYVQRGTLFRKAVESIKH